jgi:ABC-type multidrug transport system fused ATPase/permease subunit
MSEIGSDEKSPPAEHLTFRRALRFLAPFVLPRWTLLLVAGLALLAHNAFELLKPWPLKFIIDNVVPGISFVPVWAQPAAVGERTWMLIVLCLMIVGTAAMAAFAAYVNKFVLNRIGEDLAFEMRMKLFGHVQELGLGFHDSSRMGDTITRITEDTRSIREVATTSVFEVATNAVQIALALGLMAWMQWKLALVGCIAVPLIGPTMWYFRHRIEKATRKRRKREGELTSVAQETMSSMRLVKTLGSEDRQQHAFGKESSKSAKIGLEVARLEAAYVRSVDLIVALVTCGVVWVGVNRVWAGNLSAGDLTLFLYYIKNLQGPLRNIAKQSSKISKGKVGLERIVEILAQKPSVVDAPHARPAPPLRGRIAFEGVGFEYKPGLPALKHVSFRAEPGQVIALVGHSGAGKSTILSLLSRLYDPSAGRILLDGHDLRDFTLDSLRTQISVVLQESLLLQTSIRENILYGRSDATEEEVRAASAAAGVELFLPRLEEGYDTVVGQRGATLSGGERQRVAIARAIVRNAPILLLDEPTTGLDAKSEQLVMGALERLMAGRTTLVVSHKLSLIERADRILVIDQGRIAESGTGPELLRAGGLYAQLRAAASDSGVVGGESVIRSGRPDKPSVAG